ncbi:creatine kinase M-type-like [Orbicella faveolata]|uniref:creatine kinase M-type-like n=1 Tax=Orbicella faveolata TaxID=48498 RepID=UPI0009E43C8D|nr:creatine kinase M-type-like [Orbicella faveolata]
MSSFPNLTNNPTITGKLLTPDMFSILKDKCTSKGYDIDNLIESSQHNLSTNFTSIPNSAGLLARDEECYDLFSELIDPVIGEVHQIDEMKNLRSEVPSGNPIYRCHGKHKKLALLDYGLNPDSFPPQLSRDWPKGRFIWFTAGRQRRIFVNFIDHMKLVITQPGGDLQKAFRQYSKLLSAIKGCLTRKGNKFMWTSKYGFLTSSPHYVGPRFERIIDELPIKIELAVDPQITDVVCISNKHKVQLTEVDIIQQVISSVTLLLEIDKRREHPGFASIELYL